MIRRNENGKITGVSTRRLKKIVASIVDPMKCVKRLGHIKDVRSSISEADAHASVIIEAHFERMTIDYILSDQGMEIRCNGRSTEGPRDVYMIHEHRDLDAIKKHINAEAWTVFMFVISATRARQIGLRKIGEPSAPPRPALEAVVDILKNGDKEIFDIVKPHLFSSLNATRGLRGRWNKTAELFLQSIKENENVI